MFSRAIRRPALAPDDKLPRGFMFSARLPESVAPTPLSARMDEAKRLGRIRADLTLSNPTAADILYPETLAAAWSNVAALRYEPRSLGLPEAREAVAAAVAEGAWTPSPDRVVLTASTSEAYAYLFKLLCDPGDRILIPAPSYPLLDHLAALDGVEVAHYPVHDAGRWTIDLGALEASITQRTRAIVVVAPNNPTGSVPDAFEWAALGDICRQRDLALVVDEVFAPYRFDGLPGSGAPADVSCLRFRLNGLSKLVGLPQAKLGWLVADGPVEAVSAAMTRLEIIADTYLSVSTAVQHALPVLLHEGSAVRDAIRTRLAGNLATLVDRFAREDALSVRLPQGGWSAVVRTAPPETPDAVADALLAEGVLVYPGYFHDFTHDGYVAVSLLTPPDAFAAGLEAIASVSACVTR